MEDLLAQIETAQQHNLFYLSLFASLALPDICGAIAAADGRASCARYSNWYNQYVIPRYDTLSAIEAYRYRCSALHQGSAEPAAAQDYERIVFIENQNVSFNIKRMITGNRTAISIDLKQFIPAIIAGVRDFCAVSAGSQPFETNMIGFMRRYPTGISPWIHGFSVIA